MPGKCGIEAETGWRIAFSPLKKKYRGHIDDYCVTLDVIVEEDEYELEEIEDEEEEDDWEFEDCGWGEPECGCCENDDCIFCESWLDEILVL